MQDLFLNVLILLQKQNNWNVDMQHRAYLSTSLISRCRI